MLIPYNNKQNSMILTTSQTSSEDIQWDFTTTAGDNYYQVFHFTTYGAKSAKLTYQKKLCHCSQVNLSIQCSQLSIQQEEIIDQLT